MSRLSFPTMVSAAAPARVSAPVMSDLPDVTAARAAAVDSSGALPPENSEILKIADELLGALKYSYAAVAANPEANVRPDTVEAIFKQALAQTPAARRQQIQSKAAQIVQAPEVARVAMFGRAGHRSAAEHIGAIGGFARFDENLPELSFDRKLLGVVRPSISVPISDLRSNGDGLVIPRSLVPTDLESLTTEFEDVQERAVLDQVFDTDRLHDIWGPLRSSAALEAMGMDEFEAVTTDKMGFWITNVKCVDETNPEWWGDDEIALAGVSVDEDGDTKKINEQYIGGGFSDGKAKSYANWRYEAFSLREGTLWPKTYSVTLILAEKDNGGLSNFLNRVWEKVRDKVREKIQSAIGGALTPYLGPAIAAAIGQAVAWVVDVFVKWIISLFKDDIFPPFTARVTTPSMEARWTYPNGTWGNPSSGVRTAHFYGHGGHYTVNYYWKFYA